MMGVPVHLLATVPVFVLDMGPLLPLIVFHIRVVLLSLIIIVLGLFVAMMFLGNSHSAREGKCEGES